MKTLRIVHLSVTMSAVFAGVTDIVQASANPYHWTPLQIQGLSDVTAGFHGGAGQLSTINSITSLPDGIELGVTFRIGQESDPFGANYGLAFARVSLLGMLGSPGLDLSLFTGSSLLITTNTGLTVQSFLQTDFTENGSTIDDGDGNPNESFNLLFWEHNSAVPAVAPTMVEFDFSQGTEFSNDWNLSNPQQVQGSGAIRQWGLQLAKFSGMTIGVPVAATIRIDGSNAVNAVPDSGATLGMFGVGIAGLALLRRRRRSP